MASHLVPYRDFKIEYPPGALITFLVPVYARKFAGYHGTYYEWFRVEILAIGLLSLFAMAWTLAFLGASRRRAYAALCVAGALTAAVVPRRKSPLQLAALTAALLAGFELVLTYWLYTYIPWFFPFAAIAVLAPAAVVRAQADAENPQLEQPHLVPAAG